MTAGAIRSAYSYLKTRTDPKLHECSWRCFFWSMLYPGIPRLAVAAIYVCAAYFLLNRQFETAIILVMIRVTARMVHDVWQARAALWEWIKRRIPEEPPLRPLVLEELGSRRYLAIKVGRSRARDLPASHLALVTYQAAIG